MSEPKSKFPTMGTSASTTAKNVSAEETTGKLMPKKNGKSVNPVLETVGKKGTTKAGKRAYGITAKMPAYQDPQVGPTQGNGRLFSPAVNRTAPNFQAGYQDLN